MMAIPESIMPLYISVYIAEHAEAEYLDSTLKYGLAYYYSFLMSHTHTHLSQTRSQQTNPLSGWGEKKQAVSIETCLHDNSHPILIPFKCLDSIPQPPIPDSSLSSHPIYTPPSPIIFHSLCITHTHTCTHSHTQIKTHTLSLHLSGE